jgi:hypothetical protein
MAGPREVAARAVLLAREQIAALRADQLDQYLALSDAYEDLCTELLRWPLEEFDDEAGALAAELTRLQHELCSTFDSLIERAGAEMRTLRRSQRATAAYHPDVPDRSERARAG